MIFILKASATTIAVWSLLTASVAHGQHLKNNGVYVKSTGDEATTSHQRVPAKSPTLALPPPATGARPPPGSPTPEGLTTEQGTLGIFLLVPAVQVARPTSPVHPAPPADTSKDDCMACD
ncbi:MAG: hypothetical protein ACREPV_10330 [Lysobacter sp.]